MTPHGCITASPVMFPKPQGINGCTLEASKSASSPLFSVLRLYSPQCVSIKWKFLLPGTSEPRQITQLRRNSQMQSYRLQLLKVTDTRSSDSSPLSYTLPVDPISPPSKKDQVRNSTKKKYVCTNTPNDIRLKHPLNGFLYYGGLGHLIPPLTLLKIILPP